ncbi:MAG: RiPP maturation radical SAM C-methyltransferase [Deltaproteobacteria bacterium]|nr:MAG: RiPP maturation radical SAM C-methyltransferase [Deltaproteobacteria bacterium]
MAPFRLALISMPWPLANRPSIQLGTLKSFLNRRVPDLRVDCFHPYLSVAELLGIRDYNAIAERTWVAESIYAYLLSPEKRPEIEKLFGREYGAQRSPPDLETLSTRIHHIHQEQHFHLPWSSYDLIGFSMSLSQLTSTLYMIRHIRVRHPDCRIVVGGSSCADEMGRSLLANIPEIDFVVGGEGELPILDLIRGLEKGAFQEQDTSGLLWRDDRGHIQGGGLRQLPDLKELTVPDFHDYFQELSRQSRLANLVPNLPLETSRGCWWHRAEPGSVGRACRFCNLNLQWRGYRSKDPIQVADEMEELAAKHGCLRFSFVDNILDPAKIDKMFRSIFGLSRSFEIFTELRASVSRQQLVRMRRAGVTRAQIGVESLSSRLLRKINKGTTVIQNIEVMKHCEELGIQHLSNLMRGFPGSDEEDIRETLNNLKFVLPYQPLRIASFWLGQNSPVALRPARFGIRRIGNHPNYSVLLPDSLGTSLCLMIKNYVGDRTRQKRLWRPVSKEVKFWQQQYHSLKAQHSLSPLLGYRDGGDFLLVRRRTKESELETFRLRKSSRDIYRFCESTRNLAEIQNQFPKFSFDQLQSFVSDLEVKRLMFQEGGNVLSLAVCEDSLRSLCDGASLGSRDAVTRPHGDAELKTTKGS